MNGCGSMAKITFKGLDDYRARLAKLEDIEFEGICKEAIYPAAGRVLEAVRDNTPVDSGDLRDSLRLSRFRDKNGYFYTAVYFDGYDRDGTPNPLKARVLESGSSKQKKHPFIRPAVNSVKEEVNRMIGEGVDAAIERRMNDKGGK